MGAKLSNKVPWILSMYEYDESIHDIQFFIIIFNLSRSLGMLNGVMT